MTATPERTPAEELREAAAFLRDFAAAATRGPWVFHQTVSRHEESDTAITICRPYCMKTGDNECEPDCGINVLTTGAEDCEEDNLDPGDAAWMTLVHPGLAEPLAEWLDAHGRDLASAGGTLADLSSCDSPGDVEYALAVARVLNGGA